MSVDAPDYLIYTESHEWVESDGDIAIVGLTDYAQTLIGDVVSAGLPEPDDEVSAGDLLATIESITRVWEVYSPYDGVVASVNEDLFERPEDINVDPYGSWLVTIKNPKLGVKTLEAQDYLDYCAGQ